MSLPSGWTQKTDYYIECENYTITKTGKEEGQRYTLWRKGAPATILEVSKEITDCFKAKKADEEAAHESG